MLSPVLKLGFKPIPMQKIGLYAHELRASPPPAWDQRKAPREQFEETFPIPD